jgi:hypothetical protein
MPWTTTDEFNVIPKTQRMSLTSFPGHNDGYDGYEIVLNIASYCMKSDIMYLIFEPGMIFFRSHGVGPVPANLYTLDHVVCDVCI